MLSVFSTCVEVIPQKNSPVFLEYCILHVCGGDPIMAFGKCTVQGYSPRVWRWSYCSCFNTKPKVVFSTCVEVILIFIVSKSKRLGILHVCGGDPTNIAHKPLQFLYSPRVWRWSRYSMLLKSTRLVFSTCVEVILICFHAPQKSQCILHVCGGDPDSHHHRKSSKSVFSTCVEVIPSPSNALLLKYCILHVCGGDPRFNEAIAVNILYSPRVWRWSFCTITAHPQGIVFSTCVEVIKMFTAETGSEYCILHVCGGDPYFSI